MSAAATPWIIALDGAGCDIKEVGGKAAGLDRLASHGFPIPLSFALTAAAYRTAIGDAGLAPWLDALAERPAPAPDALAAEVAEVEQTFQMIEFDPSIAAAIEDITGPLLDRGRVAVRSSATAEDLATASFAGQYRTYTRLHDVKAVLNAVKACWASLWLPSAREYRLRHGIDATDLAMGTVIQSMVEAEWSGVAFTKDPGSDLPLLRIEVVPGLGESLVSGAATPLDFSVRRDTLEINGQDGATAPPLLEDLARMMLQVESRLDEPQDVEWAAVGGDITLLQARPITVVGPRALLDDGFDRPVSSPDEFTPYGVVEMLPGTVPPLLWTINGPMIEHGYRSIIADLGGQPGDTMRPFIGRFRGRPALNLSSLRELAAGMPGGSAQDVERQFLGRPVTEGQRAVRRAGPRALWAARKARSRLGEEVELVASACDAIVGIRLDLGEMPAARLAGYHHAVRDLAWRTAAAEIAASSAATAAFRGLEVLLGRWFDEDESTAWAQRLTAGTLGHHAAGARLDHELGVAYRQAVAADPAVAEAIGAEPGDMARRLTELGPVGARFVDDVSKAARIAGSRAFYGGPTWEEAPELVWRRIAELAKRSDDTPFPDASSTPMGELAEQLQSGRKWRTIRILTGQLVDLRVRWLTQQAGVAAAMLGLRERAKSALLTLGGEQRRIIVEIASRLVASRQLTRSEDVELLTERELTGMLLGAPPPPAATLQWRRSVARRTASAPALPETFTGAPGLAVADLEAGRALSGWPASSGMASGTARVISDITEAGRLEQGDILVATATDPSWTPVILDAGGLVLETGGPLSHAALVAREFGIPAVLKVRGATTLIENGETVEIDGYAGVVTRGNAKEQP